jgi:hypothetical protein
MGAGHLLQLVAGLGEGDVKGLFPVADAFEKELEGKGGFACTGVAFDQVEVALGKSAKEDVIEAGNAGAEALAGRVARRMVVEDSRARPGGRRLRVHLSLSE